jgi:apolipoprotein N-acyltransferase
LKKFLPLVAVLSTGVLFIFCFPSHDHGQWAWGAFVPCLLFLPRLPFRRALWAAFVAGMIANLGTLYWVYPTCRWGGVNPFWSLAAITSLSAYVSLYWATFGAFVHAVDPRPAWLRPFLLAAAWTSLEWLKSWLFTGFPWLPLAASQWQVPKHLPLAEMGGAYAVSFLIMLFNGALAEFGRGWLEHRRPVWRAFLPSVAAVVTLTAVSVWIWRRPLRPAGAPLAVSIVQANIDQYKKWDQAYEEDIRRGYTALTRRAAEETSDVIVWPETSVPGWVPNEPDDVDWVAGLARTARRPLLVGAATRENAGDFNAAFVFSSSGTIESVYRKQHLVPFGEYVPLRRIFARWVSALSRLGGDFAAGRSSAPLPVRGVPLGVNICFEDAFPRLTARAAAAGAQVLVNITNDGWYRDTAAPAQHFALNVLRAVETRRWVIRAANTGISGFIDPTGTVRSATPLLTSAVITSTVTPHTVETTYVRHGDAFAVACLIFTLLPILISARKTRKDLH